jgi:predicted flap endonuclease-1-like 5' DNA nuclease
MSGDRSTRTVLAALLLVAALFLAMNLIVSAAPVLDLWLPLLLALVGFALAFLPQLSWRRSQSDVDEAESPSLALVTTPGEVHSYEVVQPAPRLHTMTIRPDPEASEYSAQAAAVVTPTAPEILPFEGEKPASPAVPDASPASPETPAPAAEPQPEVETVPQSPETPAPAAPEPEAMPQSPETPPPAAPTPAAPPPAAPETETHTEVVSEGPSQRMPLERAEDTGAPAAELSHTAKTEYANPEQSVAAKEPAPAPQADDSVTATERTEPEKQVVAEKMSAPQQPYEAEQVGSITPEQAERVMDDSTDNGHDNDVPVVTEAASANVAAQASSPASAGGADDLIRIDGIGPKISATLQAAGIDSFEKLANTPVDTLRSIITDAGVRLIGEVDSWAQQAGYAARGDWQGLDTFNAERKRRS